MTIKGAFWPIVHRKANLELAEINVEKIILKFIIVKSAIEIIFYKISHQFLKYKIYNKYT